MELRDERKVVTALFADLVGSTSLGERLDAEELRLVVGDAVARIVAEVERLGGRVKDLAGDGVLAFSRSCVRGSRAAGWKGAASRTASRFPTGRSVSSCATGSGSAPTSPSCVPG